jgi:hypothetical protein
MTSSVPLPSSQKHPTNVQVKIIQTLQGRPWKAHHIKGLVSRIAPDAQG